MRPPKMILGLVVVAALGLAVSLGRTRPQQAPGSTGARMAEAARNLLAALPPEVRARASFRADDPGRTAWHYYPITPEPRKGAPLKAMSPAQQDLARALIRAGTSADGYETALRVMALDGILRDIENTPWAKKYRDPELYYVRVYGDPGPKGRWAWTLEGHHLCINYLLEDGRVIAQTPFALGANPAEVPAGPYQGLRVLSREEDLARQLYTSLNESDRRRATLAERAPFDVFTEVKPQPRLLPLEGVPYSAMTEPQRQQVLGLVRLYANKLPEDVAGQLMKEVAEAGLDRIHFGWSGPPEPGQPHYYRVQGPAFVIEFCNSQHRANHVHAVWRSYTHDFGIPPGK